MAANSDRQPKADPFYTEPPRPALRSISGGAGAENGGPDSDLSRCYTASSYRRVGASIVDTVIIMVAYKILGNETPIQISLCVALYFAWHVGLIGLFGQTPGDRMLGLYVVDDRKFSPPQKRFPSVPWGAAFLRAFALPLTAYITLLSMIAFLRPKRKMFSEWISKTRVIQLRPRPSVPKKRLFVFAIVSLLSLAPYAGLAYLFMKLPPGTISALYKNRGAITSTPANSAPSTVHEK